MTKDADLLEELLRIAAVAGVELEVEPTLPAWRSRWRQASAVLLGQADLAGVLRACPPRRDGILIVGQDPNDVATWPGAVEIGASRVLFLPGDEDTLVELLVAPNGVGSAALTIGVMGARGGAGASVLAVALARAAGAARLRTLLIDADPLGGGLDLLLGAEAHTGLRWPELAGARGRLSAAALEAALPEVAGVKVVSFARGAEAGGGPAPAEAMNAVLSAAGPASDVIVVDLPRWIDSTVERALLRCSLVLLVIPAEVRAIASAGALLPAISDFAADIRAVVRGPAPGGLDPERIAAAVGLPLLARLQGERGLPAAIERGEPPGRPRGPLEGTAAKILEALLPLRAA